MFKTGLFAIVIILLAFQASAQTTSTTSTTDPYDSGDGYGGYGGGDGDGDGGGISFGFPAGWDDPEVIVGLLALVGMAGAGGYGIYRKKKKRSRFSDLLTQLDDIYNAFKTNPHKCEIELEKVRGTINEDLKSCVIDENNYNILKDRIEEIMQEIRSGAAVWFEWKSYVDGLLSYEASFTTDLLQPCDHTIQFTVQDDQGIPSEPVFMDLTVYPPPDWTMFRRSPDHHGATEAHTSNHDRSPATRTQPTGGPP